MDDVPRAHPKTTWAVVGAGRFASERMVPAILSDPSVSVAAVWARDLTRARALAERVQATAVPSLLDLADHQRLGLTRPVDIVYVAATAAANPDLVAPLLGSGLPVLCEKPLAADTAHARRIAAVAQESGAICLVNHHLRANTCITELKGTIDRGELGTIEEVEIVNHQLLPQPAGWRLSDPISGGVIRDLTVHDLDLIQYLFGSVAVGRVTVDSKPVACKVDIELQTTGGIRIRVSDAWKTGADGIAHSMLLLRGSAGTALVSPAITATGSTLTVDVATGTRTLYQESDAYEEIARLATHAIRGEPVPLTPARSAAETCELIDDIVRRAETIQGLAR